MRSNALYVTQRNSMQRPREDAVLGVEQRHARVRDDLDARRRRTAALLAFAPAGELGYRMEWNGMEWNGME